MSDTVVITLAVDKSSAIQWPGISKGTSSTGGIESVMFTYKFMEDQPVVSTDVQGREVEPCADMVDNAVSVPQTYEGTAAADCMRTADREVDVCARESRGHVADVCSEAQLMAGNSVVYLDDEGPVARLFQWVAGICGGNWDFAVHACPEAQLIGGNQVIYQNGLVQWLLR
ncbi:hypothetical protein D1007_16281 [Hordeum vulgare]|nr:hypothetical protein D1007_16281 [Hordeum vulgare]